MEFFAMSFHALTKRSIIFLWVASTKSFLFYIHLRQDQKMAVLFMVEILKAEKGLAQPDRNFYISLNKNIYYFKTN